MEHKIIRGKMSKKHFKNLHKQTRVLSNVRLIFNKLNNDGYLKVLKELFSEILKSEMDFAIRSLTQ